MALDALAVSGMAEAGAASSSDPAAQAMYDAAVQKRGADASQALGVEQFLAARAAAARDGTLAEFDSYAAARLLAGAVLAVAPGLGAARGLGVLGEAGEGVDLTATAAQGTEAAAGVGGAAGATARLGLGSVPDTSDALVAARADACDLAVNSAQGGVTVRLRQGSAAGELDLTAQGAEAAAGIGNAADIGGITVRLGRSMEDGLAVEMSPGLFSSNELMGVEPTSPELLALVSSKRAVVTAQPGSDDLRMLDYFGAEASTNTSEAGVPNGSIILRENPSKAAILEEFLHGTQARLGITGRLGRDGLGSAETHIKDFMIRHQAILGLSNEDVAILKILRDKGL